MFLKSLFCYEYFKTKIGEEKTELLDIVNKTKDLFKPILCKSSYEELLARKDRSLSYKAMQVRFNCSFQ